MPNRNHVHNHIHKRRSKIKFLFLLAVLGLLWYGGRFINFDPETLEASLVTLPLAYSGLLYVGLYVAISFFIFFSKDFFWLVGAMMFGPYLSAFLIWVAEMINAFILFYFARHMGRSFVDHHLDEKYRHLDDKLGRLSFFWLFIFRAAPLIPYRFMDLGAGLTKIHFRRYLSAVVFGSPLKIFWIQYVLAGVGRGIFGKPSVLVDYFLSNKPLLYFSLLYPLLVILVIIKLESKD
ncbi:MAG: VTT domain-containing protein [Candidatus Omnitrophota bacterium]